MKVSRVLSVSLPTLLMAAVSTGPAFAQAPPAPASAEQAKKPDAEIIVTAQRRAQSLLDVPLSISAVSGAEIEARQIDRLADFQYSVPGLWTVELYPGSDRVQLRGISQQAGLPTVATYLDETPINPPAVTGGADVRLVDMERVEVLRGPQPTLYGEGAMGGTIRYISKAPGLDRWSLRADAQAGAISDGGPAVRVEAAGGGPIVKDKLGFRIALANDNIGGWIDTPRGEDQNKSDSNTARGTLLFKPTEKFSLTLLALNQFTEIKDSSYSNEQKQFNPRLPQTGRSEYTLTTATANWDLGPATLVANVADYKSEGLFDLAFSFGFPTPGGVLQLASLSRSVGETDRTNAEVRLVSNGDGPFSWLIGGSTADEETRNRGANLQAPNPVLGPASIATSKVKAIYGEASYAFGAFTVTGGGRQFEDERGGTSAVGGKPQTFKTFNPKFGVSYKTDEGVYFFNAARGFRSGGFNTPGKFRPGEETYDPEELVSYELGLRQRVLGGRLTYEASLYYNDYKSIQSILTPVDNTPTIGRTINAGEASGYGVDLGLTFKATDSITLSATSGYNGVEYTTTSLTVRPGDRLDNVPEWTNSASIDLRRPLQNDMVLIGRLDAGYTSGYTSTLRLFDIPGALGIVQTNGRPFPSVINVDSRVVLNGRIGFERGPLTFTLWGQNLTDDYTALYGGGVVQAAEGIRPRPRTIGVSIGAQF
jgi:outer membrane receptor protein involved in Fe transport